MASARKLSRLFVFVCCSFSLPGGTSVCHAGDEAPPTIEVVSRDGSDVSHEIPTGAGRARRFALKPLRTPGYDELKSALWSGGPNDPEALLSVGADPNATSKEGEPILNYAVWLGSLEKVEAFLKAGADPNRPDKRGQTALDRAMRRRNDKMVALLKEYGADPIVTGDKGRIALDKRLATPAGPSLIKLPTILRQPDSVYGPRVFSAPGGGDSAVYTPDSKQLIVGGVRGGIRFFDAKTGKSQGVLDAHDGRILGLVFIPKTRILVSAGEDKTVRFWDIDASRELKRLNYAHWGQAKALAVSGDGRFLHTGRYVWEIESVKPLTLGPRVREVATSSQVRSPARRHVGVLWSFFTPDNRYLVLSRNFKGIWAWDLKNDTLHEIKGLNQKSLRAIAWKDLAPAVDIGTADPADLLALAEDQYTVIAAPPQRLKNIEKTVRSVNPRTHALASSPDGQFLTALSFNSSIEVHDLENRCTFKPDGHTASLLAVSVSPDGQFIASGGNDKTVRIWDRKTCKELKVIPVGSFVYSVRFSLNGKLLAIGDNGGSLYLWDMGDKSLKSYRVGGRVTDLAFDPEGAFLVSLSSSVQLLDLKTRKVTANVRAMSSARGTVALSPDGRLVVGSSRSMSARERFKVPPAWAIDGGLFPKDDLFSEAMGHRNMIYSVAFSSDKALLAASSNRAIRLWDMKKKKAVGGKLCGHTVSIGDMVFSPNSEWLASASWDGTARVWEVSSGRQAILIDADVARVSCIDFTPDGQLVTANWDGTVHLWDLSKHRE